MVLCQMIIWPFCFSPSRFYSSAYKRALSTPLPHLSGCRSRGWQISVLPDVTERGFVLGRQLGPCFFVCPCRKGVHHFCVTLTGRLFCSSVL